MRFPLARSFAFRPLPVSFSLKSCLTCKSVSAGRRRGRYSRRIAPGWPSLTLTLTLPHRTFRRILRSLFYSLQLRFASYSCALREEHYCGRCIISRIRCSCCREERWESPTCPAGSSTFSWYIKSLCFRMIRNCTRKLYHARLAKNISE